MKFELVIVAILAQNGRESIPPPPKRGGYYMKLSVHVRKYLRAPTRLEFRHSELSRGPRIACASCWRFSKLVSYLRLYPNNRLDLMFGRCVYILTPVHIPGWYRYD